jgi:hypothetical protein
MKYLSLIYEDETPRDHSDDDAEVGWMVSVAAQRA